MSRADDHFGHPIIQDRGIRRCSGELEQVWITPSAGGMRLLPQAETQAGHLSGPGGAAMAAGDQSEREWYRPATCAWHAGCRGCQQAPQPLELLQVAASRPEEVIERGCDRNWPVRGSRALK